MPSVFRTHFKAVGFPALLSQFGEPVVYLMRSGGKTTFNAIINREEVAIYDAGGDVSMAPFSIQFYDDCTTGMSSTDIDTGGDQIEIIANEGDNAKTTVTVLKKLSQSNGVIYLALK